MAPKKIIPLLALMVSIYNLPASAEIIVIPRDYPTIQEGIDAASEGDTVLVKPGLYEENISLSGANIILASLYLTTGDTTSILSTIIDGTSSGSVVTTGGLDSTAAIVGFTIRNGSATSRGGGIYCGSDLRILHNIITQNYAGDYGGAIYCYESAPRISYNEIRDNSTYIGGNDSYGGGIYCTYSEGRIDHNTISYNASCWGGGISCINSNVEIEHNIIDSNSADP